MCPCCRPGLALNLFYSLQGKSPPGDPEHDGENGKNGELERLKIRCSDLAVGEDKRSKEAEAGDPAGSSMQADAAARSNATDER